MTRSFARGGPSKGPKAGRPNGALVSTTGPAVGHALMRLDERATRMVEPGGQVPAGPVIEAHARSKDREVSPLRARDLSGVRAAGKDKNVRPSPVRRLRREQAIAWIARTSRTS